MPRFAYVNGQYLLHQNAAISVEDRGYQFADAVYEVVFIRNGKPLDMERHMSRLERSLSLIDIPMPMSATVISMIISRLVRRNGLANGMVYLQVSRGVASRDHCPPQSVLESMVPSVVITTKRMVTPSPATVEKGLKIKSMADERWHRCEIKTVSLLPNFLAKKAAIAAGANDAWLVDGQGFVTEATAANAWIVTHAGVIVTRQLAPIILAGVTRASLLDQLEIGGNSYKIEQRPFSVAEALAAAEAFITSATNFVMPVVEIDGHKIGNGKAGQVALELRRRYLARADREGADEKGKA